jgi:hypothetical protein
MQNEIPAGTKVKVATTQKGVTTYQDAEVLAHMDGLVHVNLNGEAVSVDPSQIVTGDAPAALPPVQGVQTATENSSGNEKIVADLIANLTARVTILESDGRDIMAAIADMQTRVAALEKPIDAAASASATQPVATADAPAAQTQPNDESTAPAASAESAGEGQTSGPEATADVTGQ